MKYISLLIVLVLMVWTWSLANAKPTFSIEQHQTVEQGVESDIRAFIQRRYPQTTDVYCQQLYTEDVKAGEEMNVHFRCNTEGGAPNNEKVSQIFEGNLLLASKDEFKTWTEVGGDIRSPEVVFQNGSKISAKPGAPETPAHE